uniref:Tudor domain-containing protein n=1 Tax=Panagrellus redivivus TaxID=6233 RepID=A0A7E4VSY6_PANRE
MSSGNSSFCVINDSDDDTFHRLGLRMVSPKPKEKPADESDSAQSTHSLFSGIGNDGFIFPPQERKKRKVRKVAFSNTANKPKQSESLTQDVVEKTSPTNEISLTKEPAASSVVINSVESAAPEEAIIRADSIEKINEIVASFKNDADLIENKVKKISNPVPEAEYDDSFHDDDDEMGGNYYDQLVSPAYSPVYDDDSEIRVNGLNLLDFPSSVEDDYDNSDEEEDSSDSDLSSGLCYVGKRKKTPPPAVEEASEPDEAYYNGKVKEVCQALNEMDVAGQGYQAFANDCNCNASFAVGTSQQKTNTTELTIEQECMDFLTPYRTTIIKERIKSYDYVEHLDKVDKLDVIFGHYYYFLAPGSDNPLRGQVFQYKKSTMTYNVFLNDEGKFCNVSIDFLREIPEETASMIGKPLISINTIPQCFCANCITMTGIQK